MATRKSKPKKTRLKNKLDKLATEKHQQKKCFVCGKPASSLHHFIPKSQSLYLRWDKRNLIPICQSCHIKHHRAGDPAIHAKIIRKKGWTWYDDLMKDRHKLFQDRVWKLKEIEEKLTKEK